MHAIIDTCNYRFLIAQHYFNTKAMFSATARIDIILKLLTLLKLIQNNLTSAIVLDSNLITNIPQTIYGRPKVYTFRLKQQNAFDNKFDIPEY